MFTPSTCTCLWLDLKKNTSESTQVQKEGGHEFHAGTISEKHKHLSNLTWFEFFCLMINQMRHENWIFVSDETIFHSIFCCMIQKYWSNNQCAKIIHLCHQFISEKATKEKASTWLLMILLGMTMSLFHSIFKSILVWTIVGVLIVSPYGVLVDQFFIFHIKQSSHFNNDAHVSLKGKYVRKNPKTRRKHGHVQP